MKVDGELIKRLREQAADAREKVTDARAIPGKSEFRRVWVKHGPEDVELAIEIWQANRQACEAARRQRARERESLGRLRRIEEKGTVPGGALGTEPHRLREEVKRLTAEKVGLDAQLREAHQQHEAALEADRQELSALEEQRGQLLADSNSVVSDITSLRTESRTLRTQLEELQDAAARLGPLLAQVKQHYGFDAREETEP